MRALTILALLMIGFPAYAATRPNIVIILADDLGWNAVGYHNRQVKTPNIDRLCSDGVELDNFYVSPMCSPTRCGLMTGRYPLRFGCARAVIPPWRDYGLPTDEVTIANALAKAGYPNRGVFGKWHMGHTRKKWLPRSRGFTEFVGCYNGAIDYFTLEREGEQDWHHNEEPAGEKGYSTTLIGKAAAAFISAAAKQNAPFLCYVPFNAPHGPLQAPEAYLAKYSHIQDKKKQTYYAMITAMDDEIGRILKAIDDADADDNTVVWFSSDNGGVGKIKGNNTPLKGAKLTAYDGGIRVAACVRFPGRYMSGTKITERVAFIDILPTVLALAGITPDQAGCKPLDGIDLNPLLTGKINKLAKRDLFAYHGQSSAEREPHAVIANGWKLVVTGPNLAKGRTPKHKVELFKIRDDPNETKNVAQAHPEVVGHLLKKLTEFRKLQPSNAIPRYGEGRNGFKAPPGWKITKE